MPERSRAGQAVPSWRPAPQWGHVGLHPGLVDEHQPRWIDPALAPPPPLAAALYVGAVALVRHQRLFLKLKPQPRRNRQTVSWLTTIPRSARRRRRPFSVTCGQLRTCSNSHSRCGSRTGRRYPPIFAGLTEPVRRARSAHFTTLDGATANRAATLRQLSPDCIAETARSLRSFE